MKHSLAAIVVIGFWIGVTAQPSYADDRVATGIELETSRVASTATFGCVLPFLDTQLAIETLANAVLAELAQPKLEAKPISYASKPTADLHARTNSSLLETAKVGARMKVTASRIIIGIGSSF